MDLSAIEDADLRKSVEDALAESAARISDLEAKVESLTPAPTPEDEIEKASPEVQAMIKEQQARTEKLEKELAEERRTRREAEYVEKAKPLSILLGKAEEVGPVLAELAEKAPEAFAKIEGALTAAAQRKELASLFGEMGSKGEGELDPAGAQAAYVEKQQAAGSEKPVYQLKADFWKTEQGKQLKEESRNG